MKRTYIGVVVIVVVVIVFVAFLMHRQPAPQSTRTDTDTVQDMTQIVNAQIKPLPYLGIHNFTDEYRHPYSRNDASAVVITVLEYWQKGVADIAAVDAHFDLKNQTDPLGYRDVADYIAENYGGFSADVETLTLAELSNVLRSKNGPLITSLPLTLEQPERVTYFPLVVITAIDAEAKTVTYDSYWLGPNVTVDFDTYSAMQDRLAAERQNRYVVVTPLEEAAIPDHTNDFTNFLLPAAEQKVFSDYAIAQGAEAEKMFDISTLYYERVVGSEQFATAMAPSARVIVLSQYANVLGNIEGDFAAATPIAEQAVALNQNLNMDFSYFGDYQYLLDGNAEGFRDRLSLPHIILGDMYRRTNQTDAAVEQYELALQIFPRHVDVKQQIENLTIESDE